MSGHNRVGLGGSHGGVLGCGRDRAAFRPCVLYLKDSLPRRIAAGQRTGLGRVECVGGLHHSRLWEERCEVFTTLREPAWVLRRHQSSRTRARKSSRPRARPQLPDLPASRADAARGTTAASPGTGKNSREVHGTAAHDKRRVLREEACQNAMWHENVAAAARPNRDTWGGKDPTMAVGGQIKTLSVIGGEARMEASAPSVSVPGSNSGGQATTRLPDSVERVGRKAFEGGVE